MKHKILNTKEAADYLGVSKAFLERDRCYTARIPHIKVGTRSIRYLVTDLDNYIECQVRKSTCDMGENNI